MSSPTEETHTISDVSIVSNQWVLVPVSKIENMQIMRYLSHILILLGGLATGATYINNHFYLLLLGVFLIIIGLIIDYFKVHSMINEWKESERGTISYTMGTEYQQAQQ